jgi:hypothetical protein
MIVGFGMLGGIVLSVLLYRLQGNIIGFIPMLISLSALAIYQKRLMNTIKQVVIDKTG